MTLLDGGEPSPKGLPLAGATRVLDAAREERRRRSGGKEGGDEHAYSPLLSCCGRDEGTSGSPAGRRTRAGGWEVPAAVSVVYRSWSPPLRLVHRLPPGLREHWPSWRCDHYGVKVLKRSC